MAKRQRKTYTGYPAIFSGKDRTRTRPASMTKAGYVAFDAFKERLAILVGRPSGKHVSDSDAIEALARGGDATREYLAQTLQLVKR